MDLCACAGRELWRPAAVHRCRIIMFVCFPSVVGLLPSHLGCWLNAHRLACPPTPIRHLVNSSSGSSTMRRASARRITAIIPYYGKTKAHLCPIFRTNERKKGETLKQFCGTVFRARHQFFYLFFKTKIPKLFFWPYIFLTVKRLFANFRGQWEEMETLGGEREGGNSCQESTLLVMTEPFIFHELERERERALNKFPKVLVCYV